MAENNHHAERTDDKKAREASQNPLSKATESQGPSRRNSLNWSVPVTAVVVALIVLALYVAFLA
jgi:hypothetical protein